MILLWKKRNDPGENSGHVFKSSDSVSLKIGGLRRESESAKVVHQNSSVLALHKGVFASLFIYRNLNAYKGVL